MTLTKKILDKQEKLVLPLIMAPHWLPALGIIFFKWDAFTYAAIYWFDFMVITILATIQMFILGPYGDETPRLDQYKLDNITKKYSRKS